MPSRCPWTVRRDAAAIALAVGVMLLGSARAAEACSCVASALCQQLWEPAAPPPAYFLATVDAVERTPEGMNLVRLRDIAAVHGDTTTTVLTSADGASCGYAFRVGERYFIDAFARADGTYGVGLCGKTAPVAEAGPLIDYLESLSRPARGGRVFGSAYSDLSVSSMFDDNDRQPVARLPLTLSGPVTRRTRTRPDGTFSFDGLPAGTYRLDFTTPTALTLMAPAEDTYGAIALPNVRACAETLVVFQRRRR